ncbi:MAG: cation:proton antiporter, partial [Pirellulales bacterium]
MPLLADIPLGGATLTLGLLLGAAILAGGLGQMLRLPKVTSYLLVGVLIGPSLFDWIPHQHLQQLEPLTKLAIALVLFNLGCHFPLARARRILRRSARLSIGEMGGTFVLVLLGLLVLGERVDAAILLGVLAIATAPATTILMLKETGSEGAVTEYASALVAINNLVCIVLFEVLFVAIHFLGGKLDQSLGFELWQLSVDLFGSTALGVVGGLAVGFFFGLVDDSRRLILLAALQIFLLGVCLVAGLPYLLTFLAMGVTVANCSYHTPHILAELDRLTGVLCVVFFVTHGAELDLHKLWEAGAIGAGYIGFRLAGKYLGTYAAARAGREEPAVRQWLGLTLLAQAGAAIALAAIAAERDPQLGGHIQTVILGTVVVFELLGPILI